MVASLVDARNTWFASLSLLPAATTVLTPVSSAAAIACVKASLYLLLIEMIDNVNARIYNIPKRSATCRTVVHVDVLVLLSKVTMCET